MSDCYTFELGDFRCRVLSDREYHGPLDFGKMFSAVPPEQLEAALNQYQIDPDNITLSRNCLLVETGSERVLIDTGFGAAMEGRLLELLKAEGVSPEHIDRIVFTHGHADHISGITDDAGKLIYANADYWMSKVEWEFWADDRNLTDEPPHAVAGARKNLPAIADQVHLFDTDGELFTGFSVFAIPGHTVGMTAVEILSNNQTLIVAADCFHRPFQIEHTDWNASSDRLPDLAPGSRQKLLQRAVAQNAKVLVYHFPHPGLGSVRAKGDTWLWEPLG